MKTARPFCVITENFEERVLPESSTMADTLAVVRQHYPAVIMEGGMAHWYFYAAPRLKENNSCVAEFLPAKNYKDWILRIAI